MKSRQSSIMIGAALALALAFPTTGSADDKGKDKDKESKAPTDVVVHFLFPDDITIRKGGTVNFVVNGGGHGIAIHPVNEETTRQDIAEDLCQGPAGKAESDRKARFDVCNG